MVEAEGVSVRRGTMAACVIAAGAIALVHADPWARRDHPLQYVSSRSAATRLLPELPEGVPGDVAIELVAADGTTARISAGERGMLWVEEGSVGVGPADPDAIDGLWGSLRAATTLRAGGEQRDARLGSAGRIRIRFAGSEATVELGAATPDGVGIYGRRSDDTDVWVVEHELGDLVRQRADAWVTRRPLVLEPTDVAAVRFADAELVRGPDGMWRSEVGTTSALLDRVAVDARLGRLLSARLEPWAPALDRSGDPWVRIETASGESFPLWKGEECPGAAGKVVLDRGAGKAGCVDARLGEPWPLPGRAAASAGPSWIEPRLAPHDYGRVLAIVAGTTALRRVAGDWVLETVGPAGAEVTSVPEPEVARWYQALHDARLQTDAPAVQLGRIDVDWTVRTDSTAELRLRCQAEADTRWVCARDEDEALVVEIPVALALAPETFHDRKLVELPPGLARAIEIVGPGLARQAAHLDLGVWRLDAPTHPEGDAMLDDERVEGVLAAIAGARALDWVATPHVEPTRVLRVERVPMRGAPDAVELALWPGCIVRVDDGRAARVSEATCDVLDDELLFVAPLEHVVEDAVALTMERDGDPVALRRADGRWVREDGDPVDDDLRTELNRLAALRMAGLRSGSPPRTPHVRLRVQPRAGEPYWLRVGGAWAQIEGESWWFALGPEPVEDEP